MTGGHPGIKGVCRIVTLLFLYSLASARLDRTAVTAPIVFTLGGALAWFMPAWTPALPDDPGVLPPLGEIGLVLLLFTDASRTDLNVLRSIRTLPVRLLSTGMLLTILLAPWQRDSSLPAFRGGRQGFSPPSSHRPTPVSVRSS